MKKYFKFRKDFRCNWHGILGAFDTSWLEEQIVEHEYPTYSKHKWYRTTNLPLSSKNHYADIFLFESEGETQEYADDLGKTCSCVYFVKKEDEYDTIEELCDEFVVTGDLIINRVYDSMQEIDKWKHLCSKMNITIYGAIWTDKGLIYAAKLNDRREWELL